MELGDRAALSIASFGHWALSGGIGHGHLALALGIGLWHWVGQWALEIWHCALATEHRA